MHIVKILGGLAIVAAGIWLLSKDKSDKELGANEFDGLVKDALDKAEESGLTDLDSDVIENTARERGYTDEQIEKAFEVWKDSLTAEKLATLASRYPTLAASGFDFDF